MVHRIVSGGQTGADRAALDFAMQLGIECGGWVPKGRMAEDGLIPARYPNLVETESDDPNVRTEFNVRDSDSTLLITRGLPVGGSAFTVEVAMRLGKPVFHVDLNRESMDQVVPQVCRWLQDLHPAILMWLALGRAKIMTSIPSPKRCWKEPSSPEIESVRGVSTFSCELRRLRSEPRLLGKSYISPESRTWMRPEDFLVVRSA